MVLVSTALYFYTKNIFKFKKKILIVSKKLEAQKGQYLVGGGYRSPTQPLLNQIFFIFYQNIQSSLKPKKYNRLGGGDTHL